MSKPRLAGSVTGRSRCADETSERVDMPSIDTPYHIYHAGIPLTYVVFGPYGKYYDVEVHHGHIDNDVIDKRDTYITTKSDLPRDTHIVGDMWDTAEEIVKAMQNPEVQERGIDTDAGRTLLREMFDYFV